MNLLKKINYIFSAKQKLQSVLLCIGLLIGALLELVGVSLITELVSIISDPSKIHENALLRRVYDMFSMRDERQFFLFMVVGLIVVYLLKNAFLLWINYVQYTFIYNNQLRLSGRLIDCYLKKPYTYHLDKNSAEMVRNVMLDSERFFQMLLSVFLMLSEFLISVLLCVYLLVIDWFITLSVVIILGVFTGLYLLLFKNKAKEYGKENQTYDGKMHQSINQALGAVKDIKILHREKYFVDAFCGFGKKKMRAVRNNNVLGQAPKYVIETVCIGAILSVLLIKINRGEDLSSMITQLAAFALAAFKLLPSVSKINNYANLIVFLKPSVDLIYRDIKDTEDMKSFELSDAAETVTDNEDVTAITVNGLSYRYPHTDRDVLKGVNISIPLGYAVGLMGPTGAGKSTLADIILGILTPTEGTVCYGNMNVHEHPLKWSKKLAYIQQSIYLADETIRNNVAFGIEDEKINEAKVWQALEEAQIKDFVESLPEGLDTMVGERGVRLSGGQRQRIGIARALYDDPEILVLDEATSALDNETETAVMDAIDNLMGRKTLIIIAHRLTTLRNCQMIFKVDGGNVKEVTYAEIEGGTDCVDEKD
ncbi:MAG: ABC transporter ATP-binding protein [Lachnospiraceae bacterium]|nr:ABC transporter ATP-binding protein [Lachnospiraceae bacterium]MBR6487195.1 ABC transporter ATP-binding protein [Lachnospiraceae bacterium]